MLHILKHNYPISYNIIFELLYHNNLYSCSCIIVVESSNTCNNLINISITRFLNYAENIGLAINCVCCYTLSIVQ